MLARESVEVPGPAADRLGEIARDNEVWLVTGVNERDPGNPGTLYNALLYHSPEGELAVHHRKLVPTNHERLIWGQGDGGGLRALQTPIGRIGGLICWENYMPLARFSLVRIRRRDLHRLDRRRRRRVAGNARAHRARVARVRGRAGALPAGAARTPTSSRSRTSSPDWTCSAAAGSAILAPDGSYLAGPLYGEEGILYADLEPQRLDEERQRFDPAGHYHRPDVLELKVTPRKGVR